MTSEFAQLKPKAPLFDPLRPDGCFRMLFSSTPRGARLARRLAGQWLDERGVPFGSRAHDEVTLIVAELAANAVTHGRVPGRDFRLVLAEAGGAGVRVEVTDARGERVPEPAAGPDPDPAGTRRGLVLVNALAARWGWHPRGDGPGKTVWAEYERAAHG